MPYFSTRSLSPCATRRLLQRVAVQVEYLDKPFHNDSLPGVRSVIEATDIRGSVFNNSSELANKPAQTMLAVKCTLEDMVTGNTGLKSAQTARNTAIHNAS
ncbi:MAG: hypothetical protein DMG64_06945 [Acidobacteria bacterium]|nr:MAG: hypothetical protein DMG64_06945 [Acidobacteriota bacterium]